MGQCCSKKAGDGAVGGQEGKDFLSINIVTFPFS